MDNTADKIILMIVNGIPEATILTTAIEKLGVPERRVKKLFKECRAKIVIAASYNRDEELGRAITRLHDCYGQSAAIQDAKTCLQIQRELNKLMGLYHVEPPNAGGDETTIAEQQARGYLAGLIPGGDTMPLGELARLVAQKAVGG